MAHKEFHLRANEVRAESRALMLKLRTERLAQSRHSKKPLPAEDLCAAQKPPLAKVHVSLAERPKVTVKTVAVPIKPQSTIIVSRKVNAAVTPVEDVIPQQITSETEHSISAVFTEIPVQSPSTVTPTADVSDAPVVLKRPAVRQTKTVPSKPPFAAILVEAGVLLEAEVLEVAPKEPLVIEGPVEISVSAQPLPVEAVKPKATKSQATKTTATKSKRVLKPAVDVSLQGLGTVSELMEAVEASVRAQRPAAMLRPEKTVELSGRALIPVSTVPALGPGMVWRLNQIGVKTLADLAGIEPDDLRSKLGPVAKLVRVENWIAFARAA